MKGRYALIFVCAILFCLFLFKHFYFAMQNDPLLAVVIMVKDEESVIVETIDPFVKGGIDAFLIFDTGSTDKTIDRITTYFEEKGISRFVIEQEPFVDFAASRNRALELAEMHFPQAGFFIMPDAEWYIHGVEELLSFCKKQLDFESNSLFAIEAFYKNNCEHFIVPRLFRANAHIRFVGSVHEIPHYDGITMKVPKSVYICCCPSDYGDKKTMNRIERDIRLLKADLEKNPDNPRTLFYLAKSYTVLGDWHSAVYYLKQRVKYQGFEEEHFVALLRLGQILEQLFFKNEATWQEAENYFLQAAYYRPGRAEPLIHLSNHYMYYHNLPLAYEYALNACNIPYPDDGLSINKELYDFNRWDILARVSAKLGLWDTGAVAVKKALAIHPEIAELYTILDECHRNLNIINKIT